MLREYGIWIDGAEAAPTGHHNSVRRSPSDGREVARFVAGTKDDVYRAAKVARETFHSGVWSRMPGSERGKILLRFADLIANDIDRLARIEAEEAGKTFSAAVGELQWATELVRYAASLSWSIPGKAVTHEGADKLGLVTYNALPVVGMILPFNFPTVCLFQTVPYALVAGCSLVIKPAETTAGTTLEYARIAKAAGIPDGVVNVVTGRGSIIGDALCDSPDIDMVSFTGSTDVGRSIAAKAGQHLKKVALELGGKGANIVFADADLDKAVEGVLAGFTINQGEECCAGARLLVHADIAEDFVARVAEKANAMVLGGPDVNDAQLGPMIHEQHLETVLSYISGAKAEGAKLVCGGARASGHGLDGGYFVQPTIFSDVTPDMTIFKEEVFGPVLSATTFRTAEEAIELANCTPYGLANGLWTKDIDTAMLLSQRLQSGYVYVNTYLEALPQMPFGGSKESGLGRENGLEGLLEFMETKSTFIRLSN